MKTRSMTIFQTADGSTFGTEAEASAYEDFCAEIGRLMSRLNPVPGTTDFANGGGWVRQDPAAVAETRRLLIERSRKFVPEHLHRWLDGGPSWVGAALQESGFKCLNAAGFRFMCISGGREYGQPYYAANPHEAKDVEMCGDAS